MKKFTLDELSDTLKRLTLPVLQEEVGKVIVKDEKFLTSRKKDELKAGVNPDGGIIGTYASDNYKLFKQRLNPNAGGNVDLIVSGDFVNSAQVEYKGGGVYEIKYSDKKAPMLIEKYDAGKGNLTTINEKVWLGRQKSEYAPRFIAALKAKTGL